MSACGLGRGHLGLLVVFTRLWVVIPMCVIMHLPMMQSDALGKAATPVVCFTFAVLGALRPILVLASRHKAASHFCLAVARGLQLVPLGVGRLVRPGA